MARTLRSDKLLFWSTLLLVAASVVMVYSASALQAQIKYEAQSHFLLRQLAWAVLGFVLMLGAMRIDYHEFRRPAVIWSLLAVVVVGLLAVFLFPPRNNAQRWLWLGSISLQPSELAKLAALLFAAALLERRMHRINEPIYALLPIGIVTMALTGLILVEPDFGTAVMIVLVVTAIVFAAGLSYRYLFGVMLMLLPAAMMLVAFKSYRLKRLLIFLDPWQDPLGDGFQIIQSLIAVGSGGAFGKGLMAGVQKLYYIPEPHTDYIYAVIGEELGLLGTTLIVVCFAIIAWRGLRTSLLAPDRFGSLLALGLTAMVTLQALVNISVVIDLLPPKGIPLPFVSNGGSSLLVSLVGMGILLNISQHASPTAAALVNGAMGPWGNEAIRNDAVRTEPVGTEAMEIDAHA
jgi:cell division protein FtsW